MVFALISYCWFRVFFSIFIRQSRYFRQDARLGDILLHFWCYVVWVRILKYTWITIFYIFIQISYSIVRKIQNSVFPSFLKPNVLLPIVFFLFNTIDHLNSTTFVPTRNSTVSRKVRLSRIVPLLMVHSNSSNGTGLVRSIINLDSKCILLHYVEHFIFFSSIWSSSEIPFGWF